MSEEKQIEVPNAEDENAAMEASFAEARGETPPTVQAPDPVEQSTQSDDPAVEQQAANEPSEPVFAGLTESQVKDLLLKANKYDELQGRFDTELRKLHGKFGEVNQRLQGGGVKLDPEKMTQLRAQYPELADMLTHDLGQALMVSGGGPAIDPRAIDELVNQRVGEQANAMQRQNEQRWLTSQHRDWQEIAKSQDFALWKSTQPEADRAQLENTWDAMYLADKLTEFKGWRDSATKSKETKQKRLEAAVLPRGNAAQTSAAQTEEEAMIAAFNAARGR